MTIAASHIFKRTQFIAKTIYLIHKCLFHKHCITWTWTEILIFLDKKKVLSSSIIIHGNNCTFLKFNVININFKNYFTRAKCFQTDFQLTIPWILTAILWLKNDLGSMQSLFQGILELHFYLWNKRIMNLPYIRKAYSILIDTGALSLNTDIISRKSSNVMLSSPEVEDEKTFTIRSLKGFTLNIVRFLPLCFIWGMFIYFINYSLTFS